MSSATETVDCEANSVGEDEEKVSSFPTQAIRLAFIRKVYGILTVQLVITLGIICAFALPKGMDDWTVDNLWALYTSLGVFLVSIIVLVFWEKSRRKIPYNYIGLMVFTISLAIILGMACSLIDASAVLLAVGVTALICLSVTLFAFQTRIDFTGCNGFLFVLLILVVYFGFTAIFWRPIGSLVLAAICTLLYSMFLIIDTQMIIGGSHRIQISPEEYILAALTLFLDMIMIFVLILRFVR